MSSLDWKSIQRQLAALGFNPGAIDGAWGPKTDAAVRAFQKRHRLTVDGIVGNKTYRALFGKSPAKPVSVMTAAKLIEAAYDLRPQGAASGDAVLQRDHDLKVVKRCPVKGVEAYMLNNGCLLIPGSNSLADYLRFNLRIWNVGKRKLSLREEARKLDVETGTHTGFSRTVWHQGFFRHANTIYKWIGKDPHDWPKLIVGHSLGAASAQILSKTWAAPAIGFAAPRTRKSSGKIALEELSLSICRDDDIVCFLPNSFHRMGQTCVLRHKKPKPGLNHDMGSYIDAMKNPGSGIKVPTMWNP